MTYVSIISTHEENRSINLLIFDISEITINDLPVLGYEMIGNYTQNTAKDDPRYSPKADENPLTLGDLGIRSYKHSPLITHNISV